MYSIKLSKTNLFIFIEDHKTKKILCSELFDRKTNSFLQKRSQDFFLGFFLRIISYNLCTIHKIV